MPNHDIVFSYKDIPTCYAFHKSDAFIRGLMGPFGGAKSSTCVTEIVTRGQAQAPGPDGMRRTRWPVIRSTYRQLEDTTMKTFFEWLPPYKFGDWKATSHTYLIRAFPRCEIEVMFRALDRPDQVSNLLSLDATGAWVNEGRDTPWPIIDALTGRVGRFPAAKDGGPTWAGAFIDTNPPDEDSDLIKFFEADHREQVAELAKVIPGLTADNFCKLFRQPSGLAPEAENLPNLPKGYYQRLAIGKSKDWIDVYIHGKPGFVMDGRAVFTDYDDTLHLRDVNPVPGLPINRGWDFGLTPSCVFSQVLPDGRWLVFDELTSTSMGIDRFSDEVLEYSARCFPRGGVQFIDHGDPAGMQRAQTDEKTCFEILHAKNIMIEPGLQTLQIRLESVRKPMTTIRDRKPQFVLHPRCKIIRKGFLGGYHYRRIETGHGERYTIVPEKNQFSHLQDGLQYTATRIFGAALLRGQSEEDFDGGRDAQIDERTKSPVTGY
jgi:hypothetical protein